MPLMVLSFFRVLGWGVNKIGLLQECEPSEWPTRASKRNEGHKTPWGDIGDEALRSYVTCQHTETRHGCGVVRETLVLPEDGGICTVQLLLALRRTDGGPKTKQ